MVMFIQDKLSLDWWKGNLAMEGGLKDTVTMGRWESGDIYKQNIDGIEAEVMWPGVKQEVQEEKMEKR